MGRIFRYEDGSRCRPSSRRLKTQIFKRRPQENEMRDRNNKIFRNDIYYSIDETRNLC